MRHALPEWYSPTDEEMATILHEGTIALDTNVLLQLYRLGAEQRTEVLGVLGDSRVKSRLWIPYQVAQEYQRNRLGVARDQGKDYKTLTDDLKKLADSLQESINRNIRDKTVRDEFKKQAAEKTAAILNDLLSHEKANVIEYRDVRAEDPILTALDALLDEPNQVGPKPSVETLEIREKEAGERSEKKIPPGYEDKSKDNGNSSGDYQIWREILDHAKSSDRHVLFVTIDTKADWYILDQQKQTVGPRPELKVEFAGYSKRSYHQTTLEGFLRLAKKHLDFKIDEGTIDTVGEAEVDQQYSRELSRLRHPSRTQLLVDARRHFGDGTVFAKTLDSALSMIDGTIPYDHSTAQRALGIASGITDSGATLSGSMSLDHIKRQRLRRQIARSSNPGAVDWIRDAANQGTLEALERYVATSNEPLDEVREILVDSGASRSVAEQIIEIIVADKMRELREQDE